MKKKKLIKKIQCPKCGFIIKIKGHSGERKNVICPFCNTKGFFQFSEEKINKEKYNYKTIIIDQIPYLTLLLSIIISHIFFIDKQIIISLIFLPIIPIFIILRLDIKIIFAYSIITILLSAISFVFLNNDKFANQMTTYSYWLLVVGTGCIILQKLRK